jgi:hypothetical protein
MHEKLLVFALSAGDAKKRRLRQALAIKGARKSLGSMSSTGPELAGEKCPKAHPLGRNNPAMIPEGR